MLSKEQLLQLATEQGRTDATTLQTNADDMTGTELYAAEDQIPDFVEACAKMNMLQRAVGFVCRSSAGRVVQLLQKYDSSTYPEEPEELPTQWGFKWSTDPAKALPFVAIATSPYSIGDCCTAAGKTWKSTINNNVWSPETNPEYWEEVTE